MDVPLADGLWLRVTRGARGPVQLVKYARAEGVLEYYDYGNMALSPEDIEPVVRALRAVMG